jgi:transposase
MIVGPDWHPLFEDFAAAIGMVSKVCRVRRPQMKGKGERGVQFTEQNLCREGRSDRLRIRLALFFQVPSRSPPNTFQRKS